MQIDVSDRINTVTAATAQWATDAGYQPAGDPENPIYSKKARDLARILTVSSFGCQNRNVKALLETLIGEKLPPVKEGAFFEYSNPGVGFRQDTLLVPSDPREEGGEGRAGLMMRVSKGGKVGLRLSNGELSTSYHKPHGVRPATEAEIREYFEEFYGLKMSRFDTVEEVAEDHDEDVPEDPFVTIDGYRVRNGLAHTVTEEGPPL